MFKTLLAIVALGVAALPAEASVMQAVYTGTAYGTYNDGVFGSPTNLDGLGVTATFTYNTNGGARYTTGYLDEAYGGIGYGPPDMMDAKLAINGHTAYSNANYYGLAYNYNDGSTALTEHYAYQSGYTGTDYFYNYIYAYAYDLLFGLPVSLDTPYSAFVVPGNTYGYFQFYHVRNGVQTSSASGYFDVDHVSISQVSAVPLPASGGLVLAALLGLGMMRRRRQIS